MDRRELVLTYKQMARFIAVGLIPPAGADDRWPARTLVALIRVVRLGRTVNSLDRRLVRMRRDYQYFPIDPEKLRAAMVRIVPAIEAPVRKMRTVAEYARSPLPAVRPLPVVRARVLGRVDPNLRRRRPLREQRIPHREEWTAILEGVPAERIGMWAVGWYAWLGSVLPSHYGPASDPLAAIPFEERVVLYAILDIAAHREMPPVQSG
jgi:hypothetical protein